jgi:hypothetical protein
LADRFMIEVWIITDALLIKLHFNGQCFPHL